MKPWLHLMRQALQQRRQKQKLPRYIQMMMSRGGFRVGMGAEAVQELLRSINLEKDSLDLRKALADSTGQKRARIIKRLEVVEAFLNSADSFGEIPCMIGDITGARSIIGG